MPLNNKKWIFYGLYTAAVTLFFLYTLFPSETIEAYIISAVRNLQPGASITIDRITPVFPPGVRASTVTFSENDSLRVSAEQLEIIPEIRTIFGSTPVFSIKCKSYEGRMTGSVTLDRDRTLMALHVDIADMQIGRMEAVQRLSGHHVSGTLFGTIDYERTDKAGRLTANLSATDGRVDLEIPGVNLKELTFAGVNARLTVGNASDIRIESLTAKGSQVNGDISGTIRLKSPNSMSELDLTGSVKPHPSFLSSLGTSISTLFQNRGGNNNFPFSIKGTIDSPEFLLR